MIHLNSFDTHDSFLLVSRHKLLSTYNTMATKTKKMITSRQSGRTVKPRCSSGRTFWMARSQLQ